MNSQLLSKTALGPNDPDDGDTGRQVRGMAIASKTPIGYVVPSQTQRGVKYHVSGPEDDPYCTCPDFEKRAEPCKHFYSVKYKIFQDEFAPEEEVPQIEAKIPRVQVKRDWSVYNQAQFDEPDMFRILLRDLCDTIPQPPQMMGRPRLPLSDVMFSLCMKVYTTMSGRRAMTSVRDAHDLGHLDVKPSYASVARYLAKPEITPLLKSLIENSAMWN